MTDDRSSGFFGRGGFVNFKSGDNSGRVTGIPNKKRSKDQETDSKEQEEENNQSDLQQSEFVDQSAQLSATLNSLAMLNVANVIRNNTHSKGFKTPKNQSNPIK